MYFHALQTPNTEHRPSALFVFNPSSRLPILSSPPLLSEAGQKGCSDKVGKRAKGKVKEGGVLE